MPQQPGAPVGGLGSLLDQAGFNAPEVTAGPKCPSCGAGVQPGAVICIECGYNSQTGQRMATLGAAAPPTAAFPPRLPRQPSAAGPGLLTKHGVPRLRPSKIP